MRTYEELSGADGRGIFYRAERYRVSEVFKRGAPSVLLDSESYNLRDLSLSGLGATTIPGVNFIQDVGRRVAIQLEIGAVPLFEAHGEIVRIAPDRSETRIGVRFIDRCLDISQVATAYQKALLRADLDDWANADASISAEYRQLCSDVLHLLRAYRSGLDRFEASRPDPAAATDMLAACEERVIARWRELWLRGNDLVLPFIGDRPKWLAMKRYTELVLTPDFMLGAFARRCYEKPLGYPGDYEVMNMAYDWRREGARLSDQLIHRVGLEVGECIANRMTMMRQAIAEVASSEGAAPIRIASLGSGPAREVIDYLKISTLARPVDFTLVDQDQAALSQAYERLLPEVMRHKDAARITCLQSSFAQLLKAGELFGRLPEQDLIYSVGLIDYLTARRAKALVEALYARLAPGARLIVGNMKYGTQSTVWPVEFITDWTLAYRSEREMQELAADLPGAILSTSDDRTGRVCILTVKKPKQS